MLTQKYSLLSKEASLEAERKPNKGRARLGDVFLGPALPLLLLSQPKKPNKGRGRLGDVSLGPALPLLLLSPGTFPNYLGNKRKKGHKKSSGSFSAFQVWILAVLLRSNLGCHHQVLLAFESQSCESSSHSLVCVPTPTPPPPPPPTMVSGLGRGCRQGGYFGGPPTFPSQETLWRAEGVMGNAWLSTLYPRNPACIPGSYLLRSHY